MFNSISQILGFGLIFGLVLTVIIYLILKIQGKETPKIRKGFFVISFLILLMAMPQETNIYKLFLEIFICAILISTFLKTIQELNIIYYLDERRTDIITTGTYIVSLILCLFLMILKPVYLSALLIKILEPVIIFALGILIAIKLLWRK